MSSILSVFNFLKVNYEKMKSERANKDFMKKKNF